MKKLAHNYPVYKALVILMVWIVTLSASSDEKVECIQGNIRFVKIGENILIEARYLNITKLPLKVSYRLQSEKWGGSGKSNSSQSGDAEAIPDKEITLSRQRINFAEGDTLRMHLVIKADEKILSEDFLIFPTVAETNTKEKER